MYCNSVATTGFLCLLCVLLSVHDCVDSSMAKYVSLNNFQLLTIKVHRLLEYMFVFPYIQSVEHVNSNYAIYATIKLELSIIMLN
jgi:hypothetical protein